MNNTDTKTKRITPKIAVEINMVLKAVKALSRLDSLYEDANALTKRSLLGSIYREKLQFDGKRDQAELLGGYF